MKNWFMSESRYEKFVVALFELIRFKEGVGIRVNVVKDKTRFVDCARLLMLRKKVKKAERQIFRVAKKIIKAQTLFKIKFVAMGVDYTVCVQHDSTIAGNGSIKITRVPTGTGSDKTVSARVGSGYKGRQVLSHAYILDSDEEEA